MTFHLDSFDGPLDLLLHLIAKNKVSIYDIPITKILEQYMQVLNDAQVMDLDVAGDFVAMAAQLVYIKSKMLLPVYENEPDEDPRAQLVEMLLEYQRIKQMTPYLQEKNEVGRDIFIKTSEPLPDQPVVYKHEADDLVRAARRLLERAGKQVPPSVHAFTGIVGRETVPVSSKITMILNRFLNASRLQFAKLFEGAHSRSDIVATFLAVLELSKTRRVVIEGQDENMELRLVDKEEL